MIIGTTLLAKSPAVTVVYSPWFPRRGDAMTFVLDVIAIDNATIEVSVYTKNSEDIDPGVLASGSAIAENAPTGTAGAIARVFGLEEWLRFRYEVTADMDPDGFVHFRMREPSWETN